MPGLVLSRLDLHPCILWRCACVDNFMCIYLCACVS